MPLIVFRRLNDAPPPERELLTVADDGRADVWRSSGPAVGRFAGDVPGVEALRAAVTAVEGAEPPATPGLPPDASVETVEAGGRTAQVEAGLPLPGPWGALVGICRSLLDALVESPVAAIAAELAPDGGLRLEHRGSEAMTLELGSLRAEVVRWRDGREAGRAAVEGPGGGRVEAGPGWSLALPAPALDLAGGGRLVATVSLVADDRGIETPVTITARATVSGSG
jgi:hypothetical protein